MRSGSSFGETAGKVFLVIVGGFLAACVIGMTLLVGGALLLVAVFHFPSGGGSWVSSGRDRLAPIPISQRACPYVKAMHLGAVGFQDAAPGFLGWSIDADKSMKSNTLVTDSRTWEQHTAELDHAIVVLDVTIRAATPYLPKQVNDQLRVTRESLHLGRIQLHLAKDDNDLAGRTSAIQDRGQVAFGNASDLIGNACGVTVGV